MENQLYSKDNNKAIMCYQLYMYNTYPFLRAVKLCTLKATKRFRPWLHLVTVGCVDIDPSVSFCFSKQTSPVAQMVKCLSIMQETQVQSLGWEDPLEKEMAIHSSILPGKSHGQRSLEGYSPWGHKESDTERLHFTSLHSCMVLSVSVSKPLFL